MNQQSLHTQPLEPRLNVLFVDYEIRVIDGLRRQFRSQRSNWDMRFASSGEEALKMLDEEPANVVVSDMRMPGMCGAELLKSVRENWPDTVRFVLSGQTDQSELLKDIGSIHQFVQKPCDPDRLTHAITRTHSLISLVESDKLRSVVAGIQSLPIVSQVYVRLVDALKDDTSNADMVTRIVEEDVGLCAKILQLVDSAFFGMPRRTVSVKDAIVLIGMKNLLQLVMSARIFDTLNQNNSDQGIITELWSKSSGIGGVAKKLAKDSGQSQDIYDQVCLAGVLSHIGRAILARAMPDEFSEVVKSSESNGKTIREQELEIIGVPQELIGAYALGIWGFSDTIVESVARQETPSLSMISDRGHPLFWLHLARSLQGKSSYIDPVHLDEDWVSGIGVDNLEIQQFRSVA